MMNKCLKEILERQYNCYFNSNTSEILEKETEFARCHNIDAEQMVGMFSASKQRSPNATLKETLFLPKFEAKKTKLWNIWII